MAVLVVVAAATPASALNWSAGANLGFDVLSPSSKYDAESTTEFSLPSSGATPGLRFGFTGTNPEHEVYVDLGLQYSSTKNTITQRAFTGAANYQYNFKMSGAVSPYVTAGAGFVLVGEKDERDPDFVTDLSASSAVFGGGVGIRHKMGNGHGTLRAEARFDRLTEGTDDIFILIPEANVFGLKLGFDLWDK
jgi:opacity protein-like surface antigen